MIRFVWGSGKDMHLDADALELGPSGTLYLLSGDYEAQEEDDHQDEIGLVASFSGSHFDCEQRVFPGVRPLRPKSFTVSAPDGQALELREGGELCARARSFTLKAKGEHVLLEDDEGLLLSLYRQSWCEATGRPYDGCLEIATSLYWGNVPAVGHPGRRFRPSALA